MARFFGKVGFGITRKTDVPGVWDQTVITERDYFGDVLRNSRRWQKGEDINDDLVMSHEISIVADPYAMDHFHAMRYVVWTGARWTVTNVTVQYPRLILTIGGVYNGPGPEDSQD